MLPLIQSGSGVPIVFLHAFPLSHKMWTPQFARFSRNFRCIAIDLPGAGSAEAAGDTAPMDEMAAGVLTTLDSHGVAGPFVAVGVSMGGYVLFRMFDSAPERFRAVGLVSTRSAADTVAAREKRGAMIESLQTQGLTPFIDRMIPALFGRSAIQSGHPAIAEARSLIQAGNPQGFCAQLRGMAARPDSTPVLPSIHVPAFVAAGSEDTVVPPAEMKAMANVLSDAEYHEVAGAGHLLTLERPDVFADLFLHFLKRRVL